MPIPCISWSAFNHGLAPFISLSGASGPPHLPLIVPGKQQRKHKLTRLTKSGVQDSIEHRTSQSLRPNTTTSPPPPTRVRSTDHPRRHVESRGGTGHRRPCRRGPGAGAVRGGLLLERGAGVPAAPRRGAHGGGLLAGAPRRADVPRRLRRRHRPLGGGARALRPQGDPLRRAPRRLLGQAQPHHAQQTGQRRRDSIPVGHLLLHGGAGDAGAGVAGAEAARVEGGNRDRAAAVEEVLPAEDYHQQYLEKGGQSAKKRCSDPIRCYG